MNHYRLLHSQQNHLVQDIRFFLIYIELSCYFHEALKSALSFAHLCFKMKVSIQPMKNFRFLFKACTARFVYAHVPSIPYVWAPDQGLRKLFEWFTFRCSFYSFKQIEQKKHQHKKNVRNTGLMNTTRAGKIIAARIKHYIRDKKFDVDFYNPLFQLRVSKATGTTLSTFPYNFFSDILYASTINYFALLIHHFSNNQEKLLHFL